MSERISFKIKALQSDATTPIPNAEIQLENINLGQKYKTNDNGIASFEIESTQHLKSFRAKLIHKDYQEYPIADRPITLNSIRRREKPLELRFREKLDNFAVQQIKLEPQTIILKDANNEVITKNFYKRGDTLTLTADIESNKAQESEIKWAYKILSLADIILLQQRDSKTYNPLNKIILNPDINNIPSELKQILKDEDNNAYFSNQSAHTIKDFKNNTQELESLYKGKTLTITIHENLENTKQQVAIAIFAYIYEPNYEVCYIIHLNDYPQITIDCTLAETLRAYTRQDNIATLGWGVSYVCQRLWHDNPSNAKELSELIYIDSHSPDFIESIPNETMQSIVKEVLPRIVLQEFSIDKKQPRHKARFYVELDWDRFYMQFPIMQELEKEYKNLRERFGRESDFQKQFKDFINDTLPDIENIENSQEYTMALNIQAMRENKTKNKEVFKLYKKEESLAESHRTIQDLQKPSEIIDNNLYFQRFDINTNVFLQYLGLSKLDAFPLSKSPIQHKNEILHKFHSNPKYKQNFALYSISGAFNIFYIPSHIQISRVTKTYDYHFSFLYAACKKVRAFIIDTVNFNNDDDSDQPIGVWDYENVGFDLFYSIIQYRQSRIFGGKSSSPVPFSFFLYNSHFKKSQTHFNLGLDFFLYSSTFLDIASEE
ncbi:hypothetical protein [Helicobacter bilis]|uniref:Uncharacterized protein n=1 Tax=Helicobacter bilis TaxID=37372 RepID=A0A4U8U7A2_9HELI|nr:hypothetical protein [Helicobacter bilis]TLE09186.1 hypothetical protein LS79_008385 [Helicobacter bilis]